MAKIDRLGWADGLSFTSCNVRVGLRANDAAILDQVVRLPPGRTLTNTRSDHLGH
jgi:hypothetical protein